MRIITEARHDHWIARAARADNGDPFGIECSAPTKDEAVARLTRWLDWQREHIAALEALQKAERAYHRAVADAFANAAEEPSGGRRSALQKDSLDALEVARIRLDEIRAHRPENQA